MERQLTQLIAGLRERDWQVTVIARRCELPDGLGVRFVRVRAPSRPFALAYPWFLLAGTVATACRARGVRQATGAIVLNRVDVCAVHLCHAGLRRTGLLRASRKGWGYRVNARLAATLSLVFERLCFARATRLAAVSDGVAREVRTAYPRLAGRVEVVRNGVDTQRFAPSPRDDDQEPAALFVGSEWDGKGLNVAIESLAQAPDWRLAVVGRGDVERFREVAERAGVAERVTFHGTQLDPVPYFAEASVFVLPSVYETFSLVTYEAAAAGLPLLATRVSGVEDLLRHGANGFFIERDPADLGARLRELGADAVQRRALGKAARASALTHTWDRMVEAHIAMYESVT